MLWKGVATPPGVCAAPHMEKTPVLSQRSGRMKPGKGFQRSFSYLLFPSNEKRHKGLINLHLCRNVRD